jgi:hypothetical protein
MANSGRTFLSSIIIAILLLVSVEMPCFAAGDSVAGNSTVGDSVVRYIIMRLF